MWVGALVCGIISREYQYSPDRSLKQVSQLLAGYIIDHNIVDGDA